MIKLYLAGADSYFKFLDGLSNLAFLVSYYYLAKKSDWAIVDYANNNNLPIMLDCGAWTAMNKKEVINNRDFIDFCLKYGNRFNHIVSLDVIGNPTETRKNYLEILEAGINSIPTFHFGSNFSELKFLASKTDYIGLGGIATKGNQVKVKSWLNFIFKNYPNLRFHGFGITTPELLKYYNWHSVDGTTWMTAAVRYGRIMVNLGNGKFKWIAISDQNELKENWHLIKDDMVLGWSLENGRTDKYEEVSTRYNAKSLIELVSYCSQNKKKNYQEYLL